MSNKVVLGLGGNIGDVNSSLDEAVKLIHERVGEVLLKSSLYKTKAWGVEDQPDFLNQVIQISTNLRPIEVLKKSLEIELLLGRDRANQQKWNERVIDIDLLLYDDLVLNEKLLTLPHPHLHERNFVLSPMIEILPDIIHPLFKKSMNELKKECMDTLEATKI
jgi:2-amino-4-hydroxy-6-hydroxymethyldihydropteridine diphosphokinase